MKNINNLAFELFRRWTKNAASDYPELDFTIVDERNLENDLKQVLKSAVQSLIKTEKAEKRLMAGYDYGYVIGFIQGNLNSHWCFEYITKQSKEYKEFMVNKAILEYLKFDTLTSIRIKSIYEQMYSDGLNLDSFDYGLSEVKVADYGIEKIHNDTTFAEQDNPVIISLKNSISKQIKKIVEFEKETYLPDLDVFFDTESIKELIHNKEINEI